LIYLFCAVRLTHSPLFRESILLLSNHENIQRRKQQKIKSHQIYSIQTKGENKKNSAGQNKQKKHRSRVLISKHDITSTTIDASAERLIASFHPYSIGKTTATTTK
jgi:hypothetical protein